MKQMHAHHAIYQAGLTKELRAYTKQGLTRISKTRIQSDGACNNNLNKVLGLDAQSLLPQKIEA